MIALILTVAVAAAVGLCAAALFITGGQLGDEHLADAGDDDTNEPVDAADFDTPIELEPVYDGQLDTDDWREWTREVSQ